MSPEEPTRCFACAGPWHPASGHLWREFGVAYCGPCYRRFAAWAQGHMSKKHRGRRDFYECAATSVRAAA